MGSMAVTQNFLQTLSERYAMLQKHHTLNNLKWIWHFLNNSCFRSSIHKALFSLLMLYYKHPVVSRISFLHFSVTLQHHFFYIYLYSKNFLSLCMRSFHSTICSLYIASNSFCNHCLCLLINFLKLSSV